MPKERYSSAYKTSQCSDIRAAYDCSVYPKRFVAFDMRGNLIVSDDQSLIDCFKCFTGSELLHLLKHNRRSLIDPSKGFFFAQRHAASPFA
jgi:hypothetical protein